VVDKSQYIAEFVTAAKEFCAEIERIDQSENGQWLARVAKTLPILRTAMIELGALGFPYGYRTLNNLDERFDLFCRLKRFLGAHDEYWSTSDLKTVDGLKSGSLADDLTDIYFELARGLKLYLSGPEREKAAVKLWMTSYKIHWQQHLDNALRQLQAL
jgi:hypothetical protein